MGFDINGKAALVTGANRGIGRVITETLLAKGATKVYAAVRKLDSVKDLVEKYGGDRVIPVRADLADPDSIKQAAASARDVQLVVNNAGMLNKAEALSEDAFAAFAEEVEVNVNGLLRVAQAFAPVLKANGGGALVQLNSVASLVTFPPFATYAASKAASYSFTQALRQQLVGQGTRVVSVHPGPIGTDMAAKAGLDETEPPSVVADAIVEALANDEFHAFPDKMARQMAEPYSPFAKNVVEAGASEG